MVTSLRSFCRLVGMCHRRCGTGSPTWERSGCSSDAVLFIRFPMISIRDADVRESKRTRARLAGQNEMSHAGIRTPRHAWWRGSGRTRWWQPAEGLCRRMASWTPTRRSDEALRAMGFDPARRVPLASSGAIIGARHGLQSRASTIAFIGTSGAAFTLAASVPTRDGRAVRGAGGYSACSRPEPAAPAGPPDLQYTPNGGTRDRFFLTRSRRRSSSPGCDPPVPGELQPRR